MSKGPQILKVMKALHRKEMAICSMEPKPYGGTNPYYYCAKCRRSMIEASYAGHYEGCTYGHTQNAITSLKKTVQLELTKFLENKEYLGNNYKNYLWFKQDMYVYGLDKLKSVIEQYEKSGQVPTLYYF